MTFLRPTAPQPHRTSRSFWLGACVWLAFAASACVGPDLEPPGGSRSSSAPGRPTDAPHTPETSAAAGKGGTLSGNDGDAALTPPKMAAGGAGGSSSTGAFGTDQDAGVEDAGVDASASH